MIYLHFNEDGHTEAGDHLFRQLSTIKHLKDIEDDQRQDLSLLHEEAVKDEPGR